MWVVYSLTFCVTHSLTRYCRNATFLSCGNTKEVALPHSWAGDRGRLRVLVMCDDKCHQFRVLSGPFLYYVATDAGLMLGALKLCWCV